MLQFITHTNDRFGYVDGAEEALKGGCRWIQLRMKDSSVEEVVTQGRKIRALCDLYEATLIVDDYVELVEEIGADGVHLGRNDMSIECAREILGDDYIIGGTANTFADIEELISKGVNYIGLGPFRFTTTKKNLSAVLGIQGYTDIVDQCEMSGYDTPMVAIGGILCDDVEAIMSCGVEGVALSGAILNAVDPVDVTEKVIKIINNYYDE